MTFDIEKLEQIPIDEVIKALGGDYKKHNGKQFNMMCCNKAFHEHGDKKPSLTVWVDKNICKCHVCGIKGNPISVAKEMLGDFKEACKWLHETFSIPYANGCTPKSTAQKIVKPTPKPIDYLRFNKTKKFTKVKIGDWISKYDKLSKVQKLKMVYTFIYRFSLNTDRSKLLEYYKGRQIDKNPHLSKIGYLSIEDITLLLNKLSIFPTEDLIEFGIINDAKHKFPLSWKSPKNVAVVPSFGIYNNLIEGMMLRPVDNTNKWFKGKESRLSIPNILKPLPFGFGYKILQNTCDIYITEGHIDALSLPQNYCFIASPGVTALEKEQLGLLQGKVIKLVFDQDEAGLKNALGYFEVSFLDQRMTILKSQKDDLEGMKNILKSQGIEMKITEYTGLKDKLLKAGVKSVEVVRWNKDLGKDINELLLNGNLSKVFKKNCKTLSRKK